MGLEAYHCSSLILFYLFLITSFIVPHAKGENYLVGDSYGWIDFVDFNNWCDGKEFHVGDVLGKGRVSHFIIRNISLTYSFTCYVIIFFTIIFFLLTCSFYW